MFQFSQNSLNHMSIIDLFRIRNFPFGKIEKKIVNLPRYIGLTNPLQRVNVEWHTILIDFQ